VTELARPRQGLRDVSSHLHDFVITSWDVDPDALAAFLPDDLTPDVFALDDGRERAFVSAVSFVNHDFFVAFAPFVKLRCVQTNYRAYVRRGDERVVWFFTTTLGTPFVYLPRYAWGLPWARARGTHEARWDGDALDHLRWDLRSAAGRETLRLRGTGAPIGRLDGFADAAQTHEVLTSPTVGYIRRLSGTIGTYSVWHAPLEMERAEVEEARYEHYERLGLVEPGAPPHSVLVQRLTHYLVFLPPRPARLGLAN